MNFLFLFTYNIQLLVIILHIIWQENYVFFCMHNVSHILPTQPVVKFTCARYGELRPMMSNTRVLSSVPYSYPCVPIFIQSSCPRNLSVPAGSICLVSLVHTCPLFLYKWCILPKMQICEPRTRLNEWNEKRGLIVSKIMLML